MADATQGDTDVQSLGLLVPALISLIAGLLIHSFIIGVNVSDWWKGRSVTAVDYVVTSLGMSRMCLQCVTTLYLYVVIFFLKNLDSPITLVIMSSFLNFCSFFNFWLTSLLSIVFCLKISNFHSRLFLYLRGVIIHRTGYLIVASGLLSSFSCFVSLLMFITGLPKSRTYNSTVANLSIDCTFNNSIYIYTIVVFIPLLFYCISSVLLFSSLYHHTTKMKKSSNLSISLETFYSAMRFVSVTFIYNTLYIIGHFAAIIYYNFHCVSLQWIYIILNFLQVLHSSYLIYRTAKLRSQMSKAIHNVTDFLFQRKDTETKENIVAL